MDVKLGCRMNGGACGDIWNAVDELGREVAVKFIRSSAAVMSDALSHARALARVAHPNVVTVHSIESLIDPETGNESQGIVMEFIKGETLDSRCRGPKLNVEEVVTIGEGLISGLIHIHNNGLAHGDLHSGNVMITTTGVIKIIDILYTDSLAILSSASRENRIAWDCRNLRMILQDLLLNSDIDPAKINSFGRTLTVTSSLEDISSTFQQATTREPSLFGDKLDFYYSRFDDQAFAPGIPYAEALSNETPDDVIIPLLLRAIKFNSMTKERVNYVRILWERISLGERARILDALSNSLSEEIPNGRWWPSMIFFEAIRHSQWKNLNRLIRLKVENAITNDLLNGRFDYYTDRIKSGELGTWIKSFARYFEDIGPTIDALCSLLRNSWETQNYIGKYFMAYLYDFARTKEQQLALLSSLRAAIQSNAFLVKKNLSMLPKIWRDALPSCD